MPKDNLMELECTAPSGRRMGHWGQIRLGQCILVPVEQGKRLLKAGGFKAVAQATPKPPVKPDLTKSAQSSTKDDPKKDS